MLSHSGPTESTYQASECQCRPNLAVNRPTGITSAPSTLLGAIGSMIESAMTISEASRFSTGE